MLKKSVILPQIREQCERGIRYSYALKNIVIYGVRRKISFQTLENWRVRPMIDKYIDYCINIRDEKITDAVEDKLNDRILKGEASPAEVIFYLANRRPRKWKRQDNGVQLDQSRHYHFTRMSDEQLLNEIGKTESSLFGNSPGKTLENDDQTDCPGKTKGDLLGGIKSRIPQQAGK